MTRALYKKDALQAAADDQADSMVESVSISVGSESGRPC